MHFRAYHALAPVNLRLLPLAPDSFRPPSQPGAKSASRPRSRGLYMGGYALSIVSRYPMCWLDRSLDMPLKNADRDCQSRAIRDLQRSCYQRSMHPSVAQNAISRSVEEQNPAKCRFHPISLGTFALSSPKPCLIGCQCWTTCFCDPSSRYDLGYMQVE